MCAVRSAVVLLLHLLAAIPQQTASECADAASCRAAALEAAGREDFETFHDLAWRAAQRGPANDPAAMYLLARAQSLSGRPGDALVMLRRLAQMGVPTDARENDDFARVRALGGWPELDAILIAGDPPVAAPPPPASAVRPPRPAPPPAAIPSGRSRPGAAGPPKLEAPVPRPPGTAADPAAPPKRAAPPAPAPPKFEPPATAGKGDPPPVAPLPAAEDALALTNGPLEPVGIGYDGASRRFVIGDRRSNKLMVADEVFNHVNDLIGAASAGFGTLAGLDIDARRGDLWVASSDAAGAGFVHKLQLVSGRVLSTTELPFELRPAAFSDVALSASGALLLVDTSGARLLSFRSAAAEFDKPLTLQLTAPTSVAAAGAQVYVAHEGGLSIIDLASGRATGVAPGEGVDLKGLQRIRWTGRGLIGIRGHAGGGGRLVRIRLTRQGSVASAVEPLDPAATSAGPALAIWRDAAYYVATYGDGAVIRRVPLR